MMLLVLGLAFLLSGIYLILRATHVIKFSPAASAAEKPEEAKRIDQILTIAGAVLLCLVGTYLIWQYVKPEKESAKVSTSLPARPNPDNTNRDLSVWDESMKADLTRQCLENGKRTSEEYPDLVKDYCNCATERITNSLTPSEYTQLMSQSREQQTAVIRPIVQTCVDILNRLIELSKETQPKINKPN
ncbi:MAG TPA: hypothetical protein VFX48_04390 [Saprospiraceae bacterium]|nr:hypothetical protein [Saprospiraceae bacterium]